MMMYFNVSLAVLFFLGVLLIPVWCNYRKKRNWLLYEFIWSLCCFVIYLLSLEISNRTYFIILPFTFFWFFFIPYKKEKRRLTNGLLFNLFLISIGIYLTLLVFSTESPLLIVLLGAALVPILLLLMIGLYTLIIFLYWNAIVVRKREGHSLSNLLTFLLAIGLTAFLILNYVSGRFLPNWAATLFSILPVILVYFAIVFYNFLTLSILYQFNRPKYNQQYIIILGAGLIEGKRVSPLLGSRIEKAIQFYQKQKKQTEVPPKLLMSGGKGDDEQLAESVAMKNYAVNLGIPESDILIEANSTNTLENMLFSKEIMEKDFQGTDYHAIFSTNNFHLFRAGLFARKANIKADGIGSKTAFYYLPNAFLREFIAVVMMRKRRHLIICTTIAVFEILLALLQFITTTLF
ncbi:YdcF family protein [Enterococcus sp. CWB-B31]|uniref:YdcF family protein n=1 Tax=Enterococcus sp. CWB-B31 TaxID=2885159 RepID=UPI001E47B970|nr:YdcF family protein [Enterococcus sp. CWB-B31]MCB5956318.1 YdcF family protein [Enterococcus sp. CWB-B31]